MFDSAVVQVAIGVVLVFMLISMICSALVEMIAARLKLRSRDLEDGIRILVGSQPTDPGARGRLSGVIRLLGPIGTLLLNVWRAAFGSPYGKGTPDDTIAGRLFANPLFESLSKDGRLPSYVPSKAFSAAVLDYLDHKDPIANLRDRAASELTTVARQYIDAFLTEPSSSKRIEEFVARLAPGPLKDEFTRAASKSIDGLRAQARAVKDEQIKAEMLRLIDALAAPAATIEALAIAVESLPEGVPFREDVKAFMDRAAVAADHLQEKVDNLLRGVGDSVAARRREVEAWFDESMDRVSGWYKRRTQVILLVVAIPIIVALNADAVSISLTLWQDDALRTAIADQAAQQVSKDGDNADLSPEARLDKARDSLSGFDLFGWRSPSDDDDPREVPEIAFTLSSAGDWATKLAGLLITWLAVSQGAPFWFDLLNRLVNIRNAGKPPPTTTGASQTGTAKEMSV